MKPMTLPMTLCDRLAIASITLTACVAAGGWVRALKAEHRAEQLMQTVYAQPTPELPSALAAGRAFEDLSTDAAVAKGDPCVKAAAPP